MTEPSACYHCGLPVPDGADYFVELDGERQPMCCPGCRAVARAIVDAGLSDYYRHRTATAATAQELVPDILEDLAVYDDRRLQDRFVTVDGHDIREASLILEGIVCAACVWLNERHVGRLPGVVEFRINYSNHRARVRWDDSTIRLSEILKAVSNIGYLAHPYDPTRQQQLAEKEKGQALRRLAVAGLGTMQVMMFAIALYVGAWSGIEREYERFFHWVSWIVATPVVVYSAQSFFVSAWRYLKRAKLGMDVPVALAIGGAYLASSWATFTGRGEVYFDSVSMFTFFLLAGRFLEMGARQRAAEAGESLVRILPAMAHRLGPDGEELVPVGDLLPGDRVRIRPGEAVPTDGLVVEGRSSIDESLLTGESLPRQRAPGSRLVGGTVNRESPLIMEVEKVGEDTVVAAILRLLDRAQTQKPRIARVADRVAAWFVAALLVLAAVVGWWWYVHAAEQAFWITLSVLVVTCPCALSLATPAALTAATGTLTRNGLLTTRGHAIEALGKATHIVFDKTGTLTEGRLRLEKVVPLREGWDSDTVLRLAGALESASEHPLAQALREGLETIPDAGELLSVPGEGVEGRVDGRIYRLGRAQFAAAIADHDAALGIYDLADEQPRVILGDQDGPLALFAFSDTLRPDAFDAVARLREMGLHVSLLSGDTHAAVESVARQLGIVDFRAGMTPASKLSEVEKLQRSGATVVMVGDGVNDAPVLAGAQVSVAMGGATAIAQTTADMVLFSEKLPQLAVGVQLARRMMRVIYQNLGWALLYNVMAIPLAAAGYVQPWMAALGMSASSLLVVLNALRLRQIPAVHQAGNEPVGPVIAPS